MTPFDQIKLSLKYLFESFSILRRARLNWVYFVPVILYFLSFVLGFSLTNGIHGHVMRWLEDIVIGITESVPYFNAMLTFASVLFRIVIKILLFIIIGAIGGYMLLIVMAPLLTRVSEKVYISQGGTAAPFSATRFLKDLRRAVFIAIRNGMIQLALLALFFIVSFVPVINIIAAPALFLISAYYYGFSFFDYSFERVGYSVSRSVLEARKLKWSAVLLGSVFLFVSTIPWIGQLLGALFICHLVTAATMVAKAKDEEATIDGRRF